MENNQKTALITGSDSGTGKEPEKLFADYEAFMAGEDRAIAGFKNKVQVNAANLIPDSAVAHCLYEQQPVQQA